MRSSSAVFLLFLAYYNLTAQAPSIEWQKCLGGSSGDEANSIQQTNDGGYIIAGYSSSNDGDVSGNQGDLDYWIVKLDASAHLQWQKDLGGNYDDEAHAIQQTSDGGYIVAGSLNLNDCDCKAGLGYCHCNDNYWVIKLDAFGNTLWEKSLGGYSVDIANSVKQTSDGGYVIAGYSRYPTRYDSYDYWIVKLDSSGNLQWQKLLGGSNDDEAFFIEQTSDGGYLVAGNSNSKDGDVSGNYGGGHWWIVKLDVTGILQWQKILEGSSENGYDEVKGFDKTNDGGSIITGFLRSYDDSLGWGDFDFWVKKLDASGNVQWQKDIDENNEISYWSIQQTREGGYILAGRIDSVDESGNLTGVLGNTFNIDYWFTKMDAFGNIQWQKTIGGSKYEWANSIQQTSDAGYIVAGMSASNDGDVSGNHGGADFWIVKLAPDSFVINRLNEFFGSQKVVMYSFDKSLYIYLKDYNLQSLITVKVFNSVGQRIYTSELSGSPHQINLNYAATGVYIAEVNINGDVFRKKIYLN